MEENKMPPISQLYYNYKKTSDDDIRKFLKKVKIVVDEDKGVGTVRGYYPLSKKSMKKIIGKPRNNSLTFDVTETMKRPVKKLKFYKDVYFLVKSSSRFFLKPDIGEVFDQLDFLDQHDLGTKIIAIRIDNGYETLPGTDGEHFIMIANLYTSENQ
jgi:hypothetical protein